MGGRLDLLSYRRSSDARMFSRSCPPQRCLQWSWPSSLVVVRGPQSSRRKGAWRVWGEDVRTSSQRHEIARASSLRHTKQSQGQPKCFGPCGNPLNALRMRFSPPRDCTSSTCSHQLSAFLIKTQTLMTVTSALFSPHSRQAVRPFPRPRPGLKRGM